MGILSNTVSIRQFRVVGDKPAANLPAWAGTRLADFGFRSIEEGAEEQAIGWVEFDDPRESGFAAIHTFQRDHYFVFALRRDQRRLPATLFKQHFQQEEADFLAAHPGFRRVPKQKREELREKLRLRLLAKTLPTPCLWDVVWDTDQDLVTFASLSASAGDLLVEQFRKTFGGLRLTPVHPYGRAMDILEEPLRARLVAANQAPTGEAVALIEANRWLGCDFLLWLMHRTMAADSRYPVCRPGPAVAGEGFVSYLNDKLLLAGGDNPGGIQKVAVSGPQDHFSEVRAALLSGKEIREAVLYMEKEEDLWKLHLKGDSFHFASFKAPPVRIEKEDGNDPALEKEAVFFERMHLLESGLQLFDSLFAAFLRERLDGEWPHKNAAILAWLAES
ncbi:MAG: recombination-associated protein RdgC [Deltaproteobacteria bacterium]|nr:recombination-associated protein RdgC [Deltaproteobacteria bacterium]